MEGPYCKTRTTCRRLPEKLATVGSESDQAPPAKLRTLANELLISGIGPDQRHYHRKGSAKSGHRKLDYR